MSALTAPWIAADEVGDDGPCRQQCLDLDDLSCPRCGET